MGCSSGKNDPDCKAVSNSEQAAYLEFVASSEIPTKKCPSGSWPLCSNHLNGIRIPLRGFCLAAFSGVLVSMKRNRPFGPRPLRPNWAKLRQKDTRFFVGASSPHPCLRFKAKKCQCPFTRPSAAMVSHCLTRLHLFQPQRLASSFFPKPGRTLVNLTLHHLTALLLHGPQVLQKLLEGAPQVHRPGHQCSQGRLGQVLGSRREWSLWPTSRGMVRQASG